MNKNILSTLILFLAIILLSLPAPLIACTVLSASNNDKVLAGTNKDCENTNTRIKIFPSTEEKYGIIYFGYQVSEGFQNVGGMNDQGLWYDGASLPERSDIENHYNKPTVKGELCEKALEECASVEEVITMYKKYFSPHWQGHSMWADKYGNSIIIEYGEKDIVVIHKKDFFQVMTNFYISDSSNSRWYNSYRYEVANHIFKNTDEVSNSLFQSILDATHQTGLNPTVFSNIYDLKNGEIYTFNFHNYEEFIKINLLEQLEKGEQYLTLYSLFNQIKLIEPLSQEKVNPSSLTFIWNGNAESYNFYCSQNPDFANCTPKIINDLQKNTTTSIFICLMFFPISLIGFNYKHYKKVLQVLFIIILIIFISCEIDILNSPYKPSELEHKITIENLEPNTVYYWKVVAIGDNNIDNESIVKTFQTIEK